MLTSPSTLQNYCPAFSFFFYKMQIARVIPLSAALQFFKALLQ